MIYNPVLWKELAHFVEQLYRVALCIADPPPANFTSMPRQKLISWRYSLFERLAKIADTLEPMIQF